MRDLDVTPMTYRYEKTYARWNVNFSNWNLERWFEIANAPPMGSPPRTADVPAKYGTLSTPLIPSFTHPLDNEIKLPSSCDYFLNPASTNIAFYSYTVFSTVPSEWVVPSC